MHLHENYEMEKFYFPLSHYSIIHHFSIWFNPLNVPDFLVLHSKSIDWFLYEGNTGI